MHIQQTIKSNFLFFDDTNQNIICLFEFIFLNNGIDFVNVVGGLK